MTHFTVMVLVDADKVGRPEKPTDADVEHEVARLLAPYDEKDEAFREGSRWDWWQIGGRWTGAMDDYEPYRDPANYSKCGFCQGTGTRKDAVDDMAWTMKGVPEDAPFQPKPDAKGCNACSGTGMEQNFHAVKQPGDVRYARDVPERFIPEAIVTPDGKWVERTRFGWWGMSIGPEKAEAEWTKQARAILEKHKDDIVALVDCHV